MLASKAEITRRLEIDCTSVRRTFRRSNSNAVATERVNPEIVVEVGVSSRGEEGEFFPVRRPVRLEIAALSGGELP